MISQSLVDVILSSQPWPTDNDFMAWDDEHKDEFLVQYCRHVPWEVKAEIYKDLEAKGTTLSDAMEDPILFGNHAITVAYDYLEDAVRQQIMDARMKKAG